MNADELKKADEIVRALRDCGGGPEGMKIASEAADLIDSLTAQLTASQRREKATVEDIARLVSSTPGIKCSLVCNGECLDCVGSATGTPRGYHYRGPQEAEKGDAE